MSYGRRSDRASSGLFLSPVQEQWIRSKYHQPLQIAASLSSRQSSDIYAFPLQISIKNDCKKLHNAVV